MQAYRTLVRRELGSHFLSWTGYVVIAGVLLLIGASFVQLMTALSEEATDRPLTEVFFGTLFFWFVLLIQAPVITMRVFAQEKASGTFETLMTTPVSDAQVVMAKFSGAMIFYMITWLPVLPCLLVVHYYSGEQSVIELGTVVATFLGIFLFGGVYLAIGCFASSITRSHLVAAMVSMALGGLLFVMSFIALLFTARTGWKAKFFNHLGLIEHMKDFAAGVVDSRPVVLCLSLTAMFLFLTLKVVESRRWR